MFADAQVKQSGTSLHVEHGNDSNLFVEFTMEAVKQPIESEKEGRPIYKDVPHIRIIFPGDKTKVVYRPASDEDKTRFSRQWAAFERQEAQVVDGTPITEWPLLSKSEAMEYKAMNIYTVEALAGLPDTALTWLGARQRQAQAKTFLENAKDNAILSKVTSENQKLKDDIEALKQQIAGFSKEKSKSNKE